MPDTFGFCFCLTDMLIHTHKTHMHKHNHIKRDNSYLLLVGIQPNFISAHIFRYKLSTIKTLYFYNRKIWIVLEREISKLSIEELSPLVGAVLYLIFSRCLEHSILWHLFLIFCLCRGQPEWTCLGLRKQFLEAVTAILLLPVATLYYALDR